MGMDKGIDNRLDFPYFSTFSTKVFIRFNVRVGSTSKAEFCMFSSMTTY